MDGRARDRKKEEGDRESVLEKERVGSVGVEKVRTEG